MRRILVENARRKQTAKAGGRSTAGRPRRRRARRRGARAWTCSPWTRPWRSLEAKDPRKAELVKLRFFAGLTIEQAAEALGISPATAENDWAYARAWLRLAMRDDRGDGADRRVPEKFPGPLGTSRADFALRSDGAGRRRRRPSR